MKAYITAVLSSLTFFFTLLEMSTFYKKDITVDTMIILGALFIVSIMPPLHMLITSLMANRDKLNYIDEFNAVIRKIAIGEFFILMLLNMLLVGLLGKDFIGYSGMLYAKLATAFIFLGMLLSITPVKQLRTA